MLAVSVVLGRDGGGDGRRHVACLGAKGRRCRVGVFHVDVFVVVEGWVEFADRGQSIAGGGRLTPGFCSVLVFFLLGFQLADTVFQVSDVLNGSLVRIISKLQSQPLTTGLPETYL